MTRPLDPPDRSGVRPGIVMAFLILGATLLMLSLFATRMRDRPDDRYPALRVLQPRPHDTVSSVLTLHFESGAPLDLGPEGWAAGDLHPHVILDGQEIMAAAADIEPIAADEYRWRLGAIPPGEHTLLLTWAGRHHGVVADTTGQMIRFFVRP